MSFVTCPGREALERFAQGALADHEAKPLERHLRQCSVCVQQLQALLLNCGTVAENVVEAHLKRLEALLASHRPGSGELTGPADATEGLGADQEDEAARLLDFLAPAQAADELGRLGKYRILQVVGHGGMGVVFKAEDSDLQRIVAIKAMLPALGGGARAAKRFQREARALAAVEHDHIVRIYQVDEDRGVPFLAMEFLKGEALDKRLQPECALPMSEVIRIGQEVAEALATAHARGLIHRDVKPANIWLEAPRDRVKLVDFGLARAEDGAAGITQEGAIVGTPAYMSPEQARGENVDARSDLFSLGVVLYRLCSGRQPFQAKDAVSTLLEVAAHQPPAPVAVNPDVPRDLSDLVMMLLKKDPTQRPASADAVVAALQRLQTQRPAPPPVARRPFPFRLVGVGVLLIGLVVIGVWQLTRRPAESHPVVAIKPVTEPPPVQVQPQEPPNKQLAEVLAKLKDLNPGFDGKAHHETLGGTVVTLSLQNDRITDITPLRALTGLRTLYCGGSSAGKGQLADLSPLQDLPLTGLDFSNTKVASLSAVRNLKLVELNCDGTPIVDLSLLKTMPLEKLHLQETKVVDLSPLSGLPLKELYLGGTPITTLSALKGLKLRTLYCWGTEVNDLTPLAGMPLQELMCGNTSVADLTPLKNSPLTTLNVVVTKVVDLRPLQTLAVKDLSCDFQRERDAPILRAMKSLQTINGKAVAEFWKEVDAAQR